MIEDDEEPVDDELLAEEYDRVTIVDAALTVADQVKIKDSALRLVLDQAREDAARAVQELVRINPIDAEAVRRLQWQVTRFEDLCTYVSQILSAGREATADLSQSQADALEKLVRGDDGEPRD